MPSAFADLWASVQPIVDQQWAEPICIVPQGINDASEYVETGIDDNRLIQEVVGIVSLDPVVDRFVGRGANFRENTDIMANKTVIDFAESYFPLGTEPQDGDILVALTRPRLPAFKVVASDYDGTTRWVCRVVFEGFDAP